MKRIDEVDMTKYKLLFNDNLHFINRRKRTIASKDDIIEYTMKLRLSEKLPKTDIFYALFLFISGFFFFVSGVSVFTIGINNILHLFSLFAIEELFKSLLIILISIVGMLLSWNIFKIVIIYIKVNFFLERFPETDLELLQEHGTFVFGRAVNVFEEGNKQNIEYRFWTPAQKEISSVYTTQSSTVIEKGDNLIILYVSDKLHVPL